MPKFTYSASKGIEQSNGSGFIVQDVPISRSIANSGSAITSAAATFTHTEEVYIVNVAGAHTMVIPNGSAVGEQKIIIIGTRNGSDNITLNPGGATFTCTAGSVHMIVWTGAAWKALA